MYSPRSFLSAVSRFRILRQITYERKGQWEGRTYILDESLEDWKFYGRLAMTSVKDTANTNLPEALVPWDVKGSGTDCLC